MTTTLGSYELGEILGRGSMGEVHRGVRIGSDDPMAVKVLRSELVADPEVLARFLQERSVLCSLVHPNLVRVHDLVVEGGSAAIVMDLVEGSDLRRILNDSGTLPPAAAAQFILQLLSALAMVHSMGIVHRDVKPENVLVGANGEVRLTDFGIARLTHGPSLTRMTGLIGTPEYLAPELAEYEVAAPSADIYATGILFYELLTGFTPFAGGHPVAVLRGHLEDDPPRPAGIPDGLWALLASMLAKDPATRPTADEATQQLVALVPKLIDLPALVPSRPERDSDESPTAMKVKGIDRQERGTVLKGSRQNGDNGQSRHRRTAIAVVATVVLIAAVVGVVMATGSSTSAPTKAVFAFSPQTYASGLIVDSTWTLTGAKGDHLKGVATLTNASTADLLNSYDEVLPTSVASSVNHVTFTPAYDKVLQADPVVQYDFNLSTGSSEKISFTTTIIPTSDSLSNRLDQLAKAQETAETDYLKATNQAAPATLKTLHVSPTSLTLAAGQSQPVTLTGTMSDGTAAPAAALAGVAWSTSAPTVAAVSNGTVFGLGAGAATITAQAGSLTATVAVTVNAPAGESSGGNLADSTPGNQSGNTSISQEPSNGGTTPSQNSSGPSSQSGSDPTATTEPPQVGTAPTGTTAPPTASTQPFTGTRTTSVGVSGTPVVCAAMGCGSIVGSFNFNSSISNITELCVTTSFDPGVSSGWFVRYYVNHYQALGFESSGGSLADGSLAPAPSPITSQTTCADQTILEDETGMLSSLAGGTGTVSNEDDGLYTPSIGWPGATPFGIANQTVSITGTFTSS